MLEDTAKTNESVAVLSPIEIQGWPGRDVLVPTICVQLAELQVSRKFCIGLANKQTNAAGALVRRMAGFAVDDTEEDRERAKKRAARIVAAALAGKEQKDEDTNIAGALAPDLTMLALTLAPLEKRRNEIELQMRKLVRQLPIAEWAKGVRGLGEIGLAVIIAETGDLSKYATKRKVWRRLGLGMAEGHEQHAYSTWRMNGGLTAEDWTIAGYAPRRRAEIHACVAEPMAKHQMLSAKKSGTKYGLPLGPYGEVYVKRREATGISHPTGTFAECKADPVRWTPAHSKMDALRIMTKKLVSDLWSEWGKSSLTLAERSCAAVASPALLAAE